MKQMIADLSLGHAHFTGSTQGKALPARLPAGHGSSDLEFMAPVPAVVVGCWPWSTYQYRSDRSTDEGLKQRMREIAHQHIAYGYRRVLQRLQAEGWSVGKTRVQRIYREEGLA